MGIIRLTLITAVLIWLAMYFFGRDDGTVADPLGRDPAPAASVADAPASPEPEPPVAQPAAEPAAPPAPAPNPTPAADAVEAAVNDAMALDAAEPEPSEPEPTPAPDPAPAAPVAAPDPVPEVAPQTVLYVTGARVNVRSGPSTDYAAITALPQGAAVVDIGPAGDGWREIRLETGEIGFMSGDFLSPSPQ